MTKKHAILIIPDAPLVEEVHAYLWNEYEIYQRLLNEHDIVYRHIPRTGDVMVIDGFLNSVAAGKAFRCEGFELFGETYYGNGLIIPADDAESRPRVSSEEVNRHLRFFRLEASSGREGRVLSHAAVA